MLEFFTRMDQLDAKYGHVPGTGSHTHLRWMESLKSFNPLTYEFTPPDEESPESEQAEPEAHSAEVVDISSRFRQRAGQVFEAETSRADPDSSADSQEPGGEVLRPDFGKTPPVL